MVGKKMIDRQYCIRWAPLIAIVAGWMPAASALAQENADEGGFQVGIGLHFDRDDNIYDGHTQEIESWVMRVSPDLLLSSAPGERRFSVQYLGNYGKFDSSESDDDYSDHLVTGRGLFQTGSSGSLDVSVNYEKGHDRRGTRLTQGVLPDSPEFPPEPDEFERTDWAVGYTHGRKGARGRLEFSVGENSLEYNNNRERAQFFDRDDSFASAGLTFGLRERTAFVMEARYTNSDYVVDRPGEASLDGDSWGLLIGVTWEATARTEGSVRVGTQRRTFDDPDRTGDERTASWDVAVRWSPREHSHFDFETSRGIQETIGGGSYIDRSNFGVGWIHEWGVGLESELSLNWREDDFIGVSRKQDESGYYFGLRLPRGERLLWEAGVSYRDRSTGGEIENLEFEGLLYTIGVNLQLIR